MYSLRNHRLALCKSVVQTHLISYCFGRICCVVPLFAQL